MLAGDGPRRSSLVAQSHALELQDVTLFLGQISHETVPGMLAASDIVAMPSLAEGMSLTLLEAMVCGRPVVASNIPAIASVIEDGVTGRLVPVAQPAALARTFVALLSHRELATEIGARARDHALARYDQHTMIANYERVFMRAARSQALVSPGTPEASQL